MADGLNRLITDLGERSTYDAASQCSRCGYCEQACPTYVATGREARSARGRNQVVRLMLEGKLTDPKSAAEALSTCLLCGACSSACYAHVPTADIVLEGRRMLRKNPSRLPAWLLNHPRVLNPILKAGFALKRSGISTLARKLGVTKILGLSKLARADSHLEKAPKFILSEKLAGLSAAKPAWLYFAACGPNFVFSEDGAKTVDNLNALLGAGSFLGQVCCGLMSYNYGDIDDARKMARTVIERAEQNPSAAIVADCSSCVAFLKTYPQLFTNDDAMTKRSTEFSKRVKDVLEVYAERVESFKAVPGDFTVTYHDSCRARHGQGLISQPRNVMRALFGERFREIPEPELCCGGAGAFAFENPELSDQVLRRKVGLIAGIQARMVVTSSTSCLAQLAHGLRSYYPECRIVHISDVVAKSVNTQ
jgi:glycolate oxidase iron-sulfur subunit